MREKISSAESIIDYKGVSYLVRACNSEGILRAFVTLKDTPSSRTSIDHELKQEVGKKIKRDRRSFFP